MTVDLWHETREKVREWEMGELLVCAGLAVYGNEADQFTPQVPLVRSKLDSQTVADVQPNASASASSASFSSSASAYTTTATTAAAGLLPSSATLIPESNTSTAIPYQLGAAVEQFTISPIASTPMVVEQQQEQQRLLCASAPSAPAAAEPLLAASCAATALAAAEPLAAASATPPASAAASAPAAPRLPPWADPSWKPEPLFTSNKVNSRPSQVLQTKNHEPSTSSLPTHPSSTPFPIASATSTTPFFNGLQSFSL